MKKIFFLFYEKISLIRSIVFLKRKRFIEDNLKYSEYLVDERSVFFGYYDKSPFSFDNKKVLAHSVKGDNTPPVAGDVCFLGFFNLKSGDFCKFGETMTWCWQQGSRLQWSPTDQNVAIYNKLEEKNFISVFQNVLSGEVLRKLKYPIYDISPDCKWGVTLNFSRLHRLRPGYGYVQLEDQTISELAPKSEGVWLVEIEKNSKRLLISLDELSKKESVPSMENAEHYVNFISISKTGTSIAFLHVWLNGQAGGKNVRLVVIDSVSGKILFISRKKISHYSWIGDEKIIATVVRGKRVSYVIFNLSKKEEKTLVEGTDVLDGHPSFFNETNRMITDTVVDKFSCQKLSLFDNTGKHDLFRIFVPPVFRGEVRCDFHPRWDRKGKMICVDSPESGRRKLVVINL